MDRTSAESCSSSCNGRNFCSLWSNLCDRQHLALTVTWPFNAFDTTRTMRHAQKHVSRETCVDEDTAPPPKRFVPKRDPGPQLDMMSNYTPLDLFSLFIDRTAFSHLCSNINKQAAKNIAKGKKYPWTMLEETEFHHFLGLVFYFCLVKLKHIIDYWRRDTFFSIPFPPTVMTRDRYRTISWNIHMSDPDTDVENDRKRGTEEHDKLFRLRPLLDTLTAACKSHYHPKQNLSTDERMGSTKAHTGMTRYMKNKPTKWGFKLFVLADSSNGYTVDFKIYTGKCKFTRGRGLSYDTVMSLMDQNYLGGGYNLYVDSFYTSPCLFKDLLKINVGACGTYRDQEGMGTIRWIRDGPIVFVKWMDTREVSVCSTIHPAYTGDKVSRRTKDQAGRWGTKHTPRPNPIIDYNKHMGGVDLSDQLVQYYTAHRKTMRWYRTLFYHFLDIAGTNAFILHQEISEKRGQKVLTHKQFIEELTAQLLGTPIKSPPAPAPAEHLPVAISNQEDPDRRASYGRRSCAYCRQTENKKMSTPWKCQKCDVPLCMILDRNCFLKYHSVPGNRLDSDLATKA
uniref:PiggyBac transposable element-derived protein domain-containing protein n=1 Tax=Salarias fasciatus TaxID=181472 RepID=A0A672IWT9_SALFA